MNEEDDKVKPEEHSHLDNMIKCPFCNSLFYIDDFKKPQEPEEAQEEKEE